jgi:hypothetical protein
MKDVLDEAGVVLTKENRHDVDRMIHDLVDVAYKDCTPTWREVKGRIQEDPAERQAFVDALRRAYRGL